MKTRNSSKSLITISDAKHGSMAPAENVPRTITSIEMEFAAKSNPNAKYSMSIKDSASNAMKDIKSSMGNA